MGQRGVGQVSAYGTSQLIPINKVFPSPFQVRKEYGKIEQLAADIKTRGLLQPILVRPTKRGYEVVHGHRRRLAIKSLGLEYIKSFIKEMSNIEAIIIQGCENIHRKNYDAIEEATLYSNYQEYMLKEEGIRVGANDIAKVFTSTRANVNDKMGLLDLPVSVQVKIIEGQIPVRKALRLVTLTRESVDDASSTRKISGVMYKERTDEFFPQIERIVEEIERGTAGGLRTDAGVSKVVALIREGRTIDKALEGAKLRESIDIAKKRAEEGKTPDEIIAEIIKSQQDPEVVIAATINLNIENIRKMLSSGMIKCPHCGEDDLEWSCQHERLVSDGDG